MLLRTAISCVRPVHVGIGGLVEAGNETRSEGSSDNAALSGYMGQLAGAVSLRTAIGSFEPVYAGAGDMVEADN